MISLHGQIAFITGSSSGIGEACAHELASAGMNLILVARRQDRLLSVAETLRAQYSVPVLPIVLDVRNRQAVDACLQTLPPEWQSIDVLINNAGLSRGLDPFPEGDPEDWEEMIDTNVKGLLYVTRALLPGLLTRQKGHVVNIGSIAGYQTYPRGNVYCATKAAVRALSEGLRQDLLGTPIRVTEIAPGMVETEFSQVRFHGDQERAARVYAGVTPLTGQDIAEIVLFCLSRPAHVNISQLIVFPTDQASATLLHRVQSLGKE